ncbi:MAG: CoA-binding protein [Chloroflexi bacterium]|nr:CoA-binding protein [Chloroflexota bacterium]
MGWSFEEMDRMFNPRVVAVVGDKQDRNYNWLRSVSTLEGKVYSVQIDPSEIPGIEALGVPNYPSVVDIPEPVDYVIVSVPRRVAPRVLADAIKKGVGGVMFFTSGFAETGEPEGVQLQETLREMALKAGMKVVGPNCMGIFNPRVGLRHSPDQYHGESGPVAFISQSGTHAGAFTQVGYTHGIRVSKSVSMGNGIVLHVTDYLRYLVQDPQTELIAMYVEGVPNGQELFRLLREVAPRKPVVIWKGGQTQEGARAARSHTASLAASQAIWNAMLKQTGAVGVDSLDELIDVVKGLLFVQPPPGPSVGLIAMTGGQSVVITDSFARAGLQVPLLTERSYEEFATFYSTVGGSYRNPLDMTPASRDVGLVRRVLGILERDEHVESIVYELNLGFLGQRGEAFWNDLVALLAEHRATSSKPFLCILTAGTREKEAVDARQELAKRRIAAYPSFQRAAVAFKRLLDCANARRELAGEILPASSITR